MQPIQPHTRTHPFMRGEDGNTLIELAVSLPILFLMYFGFINFALVASELCNITYATHAAERYAITHSGTNAAPATTATITTFLNPFIWPYPANIHTVAVTYPTGGTNAVGNTVKIVVTMNYTLTMPGYTLYNFQIASTAQGVILY